MKVQALAESVTIRGESPIVDVTKAEISGTVTREQIETLPLNSRQYLSLALLVPGTTVDATRSFFATVNVGGSMTFNGTGNVVDGTINNWAEDGEPRQDLPEDAVEEFKVTNAGYKAEFGLATGGVVQVVTKSGSEQLSRHGVRVLPQQGAERARASSKPKSRTIAATSSAAASAARSCKRQGALLRRRSSAPTPRSSTPCAPDSRSSTRRSRARSRCPRHATCTRGASTGRSASTSRSSPATSARTTRRPVRAAAASAPAAATKTCRGNRSSSATPGCAARGSSTTSASSTRTPRSTAIRAAPRSVEGDRRVPAGARQRDRPASTAFPSLTYGNNYDYISPESRWEFRDTYALNARRRTASSSAASTTTCPTSRRAQATRRNPAPTRSTRDQFFDPNDPASIAALTGAATFSASTPYTTSHPTKYYVGFVQDDWRVCAERHGQPRPALRAALRQRQRGSRPQQLPGDAALRRRPACAATRTTSARASASPGTCSATARRCVRAGYGKFFGHIRLLGTLGEFNNFKQFSISIPQPGVSGSLPGPRPR